MNINEYLITRTVIPGEKPLDRIPLDGGFAGIYRTIACIGDSLSSGEFEAVNSEGKRSYHDYFEYSWGQYIARQIGSKVYNFSRGGMTAKEYWNRFAEANGFWDTDKLAQAYILALGVNDVCNQKMPVGELDDYLDDSSETFAAYYVRIIERLRKMQPDAHFYLMTMPTYGGEERMAIVKAHAELLYKIAEKFDNTFIIDLMKYGPVYDEDFRRRYFLRGHMNPMGYMLTARMVTAYIDYIIRSDPEKFYCAGFIGKELPEDVKEINRQFGK